jgi:hypothetical protein
MICNRLLRFLLVGLGFSLLLLDLNAATNTRPMRTRAGREITPYLNMRATNLVTGAGAETNVAPPVLPGLPAPAPGVSASPAAGAAKTAPAIAAPAAAKTNAPAAGPKPASPVSDLWQRLMARGPYFPAAIGIALALGVLFLVRAFQARKPAPSPDSALLSRPKLSAKSLRKAADARVHSCTILQCGSDSRKVWQFEARGHDFALNREQNLTDGQPLPAHVAKDWRSLFQRKLNVAWLPADQVFLRVAHFPKSDFAETYAMVELQLEKLSPMPVAQIAWSIHVLPHQEETQQTVVLILVARSIVEDFLGRLEGQGFLADRLELPILDQLQTTPISNDGAYIYPGAAGGSNTALVAWWYGGILRSLGLLHLPAVGAPAALREQLVQMAWAGEMEGWLTEPPSWQLVASETSKNWEEPLREGLDQPVALLDTPPARDLAALTARRAAHADPAVNLLPAEFVTRYRQQFVDRLWMRGLLAVAGLYLAGLAVYFVALTYASYRTNQVVEQVVAMGPTYTNAIQLRDRFKVLKERQELKYAGLDCWNATAQLLPENVTLETLNFTEGKRLSLNGSAPSDQIPQLLAFEKSLRSFAKDGQPLFDANRGDSLQYRIQGTTASWTLNLELKRAEVQ